MSWILKRSITGNENKYVQIKTRFTVCSKAQTDAREGHASWDWKGIVRHELLTHVKTTDSTRHSQQLTRSHQVIEKKIDRT